MNKANKWKMNRAGLMNFWYYDEETFDFSDGKLLLRGSNGSGKSVTMQSFLPVLLDGRKSPDRLDPFGSKARRMEDYLLGEKEVVNRDERTGYLFLEFKREDTNQYTTIGIGLQAKRHKAMKFWGFVITDNRRIGHDLELFKYERNAGEKQKIPRSRVELENVIADGGHVVQTQTEYMKLVNKYIFGFEAMEAYEDLIKLLIQLRSPKLSKDFKPTVIYDILEAALPPLSDEDLRHLSDTIEQMDQTKQQIEQLDREFEAIKRLCRAYDTYNERMLADHADEFLNAAKRVEKEETSYKQALTKQDGLNQEITLLQQEIQELNQQQEVYQKQKERLQSHKVWNLESERHEEEEKLRQFKRDYEKKDGQLSNRRQKEITLKDKRNQLEETIEKRDESIQDQLLDMANDAEEASFNQHEMNQQDFLRHRQSSFDFSVWKQEANDHLQTLEHLVEQFRTFEALKNQYTAKDKEMADEKQKLDEAAQNELDWLRLFEEDKEKKLNEVHDWVEHNGWIENPQMRLQEASRGVHSLYEPITYEAVVSPFREAGLQYEQDQRKDLSHLNFQQGQLDKQIQEKETELKEWKEKKDPEPAAHESTKEARERLKASGKAFIPFYAAVEFQEHVPSDVRERLEAAFIDSGVLDALISSVDLAVEHDRILTPKPNMMAHTLADYLKPDLEPGSEISASLVDEVLRSILVENDDAGAFSINEQGHYQIGLIKGHAVSCEDVRYIGRTARKRYRQEQINKLQEEIDSLKSDKAEIEDEIESVQASIEQAKTALNNFPDDHDLKESFQHIEKTRLAIQQHTERFQKLSDELKDIYREYQHVKRSLDEQTRAFNIESSREAYRQAKETMSRYEKDLFALVTLQTQYLHEVNRQKDITDQLSELVGEVDDLQGELNILEDKVQRTEQNVQQIKKQLEQEGAADIRKQISDVQQTLEQGGRLLKDKETTLPVKETELKHAEEHIIEQRKKRTFRRQMCEAWQQSLEDELNRQFVLARDDENDLYAVARTVVRSYGPLLKEKESSQIDGQLTREFFNQQTDLMEYRMKDYSSSVSHPDWMNETTDDAYLPHIEQWKQKSGRRIIELNYQGKQVSPYYVKQMIEEEQVRQERFLNEQDQQLYEEILFKSVGNKLRSRIRRAEKWTTEMNHLMETSNSSSGLTFSIKWKPRTADAEEEMDTKDLVHLLKQDARLLKEEDLSGITSHFRSKIAKAKELIDEKGEGQTLLQVLKEVLDYRKWFSFVLSYRREGEPKRELTNHAFYKFSGGEKAMAMYIPLFAACYSRYQEADQTAPYIISLDEAFAGVDENNIREMFEIVEQLGFDYMMNSQVLWGDYDTISELSICELVRPKNADFVSVIRYYWDGNKIEVDLQEEAEAVKEEEETLV